MIIKDILVEGLKTISPEATLIDARNTMLELNIRHLPVKEGNRIIGILSDRDIQRAGSVVTASPQSKELHLQQHKKVSDYMTTPVFKMKVTDSVDGLVKEMMRQKISCTLIQDDDSRDVGIITTEDLLLLLLDKLEGETSFYVRFKRVMLKRHV